jgi:hypothetical protein
VRGQDCIDLGFGGGALRCASTCTGLDLSGCTGGCGNDFAEPGEACDGADLGGSTCADLGFSGGTLACGDDCAAFDMTGCGDGCGNHVLEAGEVCDGPDTAGLACADLGFTGGTLGCSAICDGYDVSTCTGGCGNDTREDAETCDGADLAGQSCATLGFEGGTLGCTAVCDAFVRAGCTGGCGNGVAEPLEACDGNDLRGQTCVDQGFEGGEIGCRATCLSLDLSRCAGGCGNDAREGDETCDGADLAGQTCVGLGFTGGDIGCAAGCTAFDTSRCTDEYRIVPFTYSWVEIGGTGRSVSLLDDDWDGSFPIGFTFAFFGVERTTFYIGSNGFISFAGGSTSMSDQCPLPDSAGPNHLVAIMWDDLDPSSGDLAYYQTFAACPVGAGGRCLVVQYDDYHHYGSGSDAGTFEAVLFENGSVLLQYQDTGTERGRYSTTGIEGSGSEGLTYACERGDSLTDGLAICFRAPHSTGC